MAESEDFLGDDVDDASFHVRTPPRAPRTVGTAAVVAGAIVAAALAAAVGYAAGHGASRESALAQADNHSESPETTPSRDESATNEAELAATCHEVLDALIADQARGLTPEGRVLEGLGDRCDAEYQIWQVFQGIVGFYDATGPSTCGEYEGYATPLAIGYARQFGYCTEDPNAEPVPDLAPPSEWTCDYEPTFDDDWHNDALCTNGTASVRPYLRADDDFVEKSELMESAAEWAREQASG